MERLRKIAIHEEMLVPGELLRMNAELTDANAVVFDAANAFHGCIPGINEVLRRRCLLPGNRCLNPDERLSPRQAKELTRIERDYTSIDGVDRAAREARERGAGIEIEYIMRGEPNMRTMEQKHRRLRNYFEGGVRHGYMTESVCAYFCGLNDLHLMAASDDGDEQTAYDDHFRFVQGTYEIGD